MTKSMLLFQPLLVLFNLLLKFLESHPLTRKHPFQLKMDPIRNTSAVISVLLINAGSLKKPVENFQALTYCFDSPPSILCTTETLLNTQDDSNALLIKGSDQCRVKSRELRGGGVMIQALKGINIVEELPIVIEEALSVKISLLGFPFVIMVIYNPPRIDKHDCLESLDAFLEQYAD